MKTYTLKIESIKKETEDTHTFCFKQPGLKKIKYLPGQYLTVIVNINGRKYRRPYSFSSSPAIDGTLDITVKRVIHGMVSNHLIDVVKENDLLEVIEPMGDFIYDSAIHADYDIFLWGAGSGITPLMSILKYALYQQKNNVYLSYCNRSNSDTIFYEKLKELEKTCSKFKLHLFCTQEINSDSINGRISEENISDIINHGKDLINSYHYICGPDGLKNSVRKVLSNRGLSKDHILSEDFENNANEEELHDIKTQSVEIILNNGVNIVEVIRGKSVLEAGLDLGLDIPYSCQTGTCHLCKAKLLSGEVKIIGNEYDNTTLSEGEFLLCCSYPQTNNISFKLE